ncbi:MAG: GntR family transcriptional regulator [Sphingomonadaceae bacterium]|uniref:GntR family transcriptional regulator n=1 Tax=Thermaurantiacus sp. TaxID=2820283 RepID=UPI00298EE01A|nr:GntR family transcriptional regulator [Thermaurantiacus sp.]MCS6987556.1 GntR family transcriptional regulator [Sphingomonadaceae bacterium]MDW8415157.1 GntR family transcriptional regulator [Thermaurantiacus sp.]
MTRASDRAYAQIRQLIRSGAVRPGEALTEEELARRTGVSRTPVREALRRLESELLVVRTATHRLKVADWTREDIDELFALRGLLEAHAARRAAARIGAEGLRRLEEACDRLEQAIAAHPPRVAAFVAANRDFHGGIVEAAASPRLKAALALVVEQPVVERTAERYSAEAMARSAAEHREIIQALAAHDADWAAAVMTAHIRRAHHVFAAAVRSAAIPST